MNSPMYQIFVRIPHGVLKTVTGLADTMTDIYKIIQTKLEIFRLLALMNCQIALFRAKRDYIFPIFIQF